MKKRYFLWKVFLVIASVLIVSFLGNGCTNKKIKEISQVKEEPDEKIKSVQGKESLSFPKDDYEYLWYSYCRDLDNKYESYYLIPHREYKFIFGIHLAHMTINMAPMPSFILKVNNKFPVILDNTIISNDKNKLITLDKESGNILWTKKYEEKDYFKNLQLFFINDKKNIILGNSILDSKDGKVIFNYYKSNKGFLRYYKEPIIIINYYGDIKALNLNSMESWEAKGSYLPLILNDNKLICFSVEDKYLFITVLKTFKIICLDINTGKTIWENKTGMQNFIGISKNNIIIHGEESKIKAIDLNTGNDVWEFTADACKILDNGEVILVNKEAIYFVDGSNGTILKEISLKNHFNGKKDFMEERIFAISEYYGDYIILYNYIPWDRAYYFKLINLKEDKILLEKKENSYFFQAEKCKIYKDNLYFSDSKSCLEIIQLSNINEIEKITTTDKDDFIVRFIIDNDLLILVTHKGNLHVLRILT